MRLKKIRRASGPRRVRTSRTVSFLTGIFARKGGGPGGPQERISSALGRVGSRWVASYWVGVRRGPLDSPKTAQDASQTALCFASFFPCDFLSIFDRFCLPTWHPKSNKIVQKSMPRCIPSWTPFFDRFLIGFCSQLGPPDPEKSSPRCSQSTILEKSPPQVNINF